MKARLVWLILCGIWGSTWLFIKVGLEDLPPLTFAGIRFVIAAIILTVVARIRGASLPRSLSDWGYIAVTGMLAFSVNYGLLFWGEQHISSGLASVLQATIPAFGLVFAHFLLANERMTPAKAMGVTLGIVGVGIVFSNQLHAEGTLALWGSAAIVVGAIAAALSSVLIKRRTTPLDPAVLAAGQMVCGLVPLLVAGALTEGSPLDFSWTPRALVCLFYLAIVGSAVAFSLFYWLIGKMDVTKTMLIALVTPILAVSLGVLVLHEELTWRLFIGGATIIGGIGMITASRSRELSLSASNAPHAGVAEGD
jgi:drug/metabolite transporter (DMT)-like permease